MLIYLWCVKLRPTNQEAQQSPNFFMFAFIFLETQVKEWHNLLILVKLHVIIIIS